MQNAPTEPVDIAAPRFKANPHPTYARWRNDMPVLRVRLRGPARGADEAFLVSRYNHVSALLKDPRLVKEPANAGLRNPVTPAFVRPLMRNMLALDDPDHARLKRLIQTAFTPRRIALLRAQTETISSDLIERLLHGRQFDLISEYAMPLPVAVISEMLGVPERDRERFARWSGALIRGGASSFALIASLPHIVAFLRYLTRFIADKRKDPGDDLVSDLVRLEVEGQMLDQDELMAMVAILLNAGHETTTNLIGNSVIALLDWPDAAKELLDQRDLMESGVEELLRFAGPVATSTPRFACEDMDIAGVAIPRGSLVLGLIASANRDETHFTAPDRIDLARSPNRHLTFGEGGHYCIGAALARMETRIALRHILERLPNLRLAVDRHRLSFTPGLVLSGPRSCPVISRDRNMA